jgi:hypothetical protein
MALMLRTVPAARGPRWIGEAFRLFARKPLALMLMFVAFLLVALVASLVPVLGTVVQMMSLPLLSLGFMVAGQNVLLDGKATPMQFVEPLRGDAQRRKSLLILCLLYGVLVALVLLLADGVSHQAWARWNALSAQGPKAQAALTALLAEPGVTQGVLILAVLGTAVSIPFWHAPALIHWGGQTVGHALFSSTLALWRNKGAMLMYMLAWLGVIMLFGVLTAMVFNLLGMPQLAGVLGLPAGLMFSTVFYLSGLFCFNDSFGGAVREGDREAAAPPEAQA